MICMGAIDLTSNRVRQRIVVAGVVQGVGFRPFVFNLAARLKLSGSVFNSSTGVVIEAEGHADAVEELVSTIRNHPPVLSRVGTIEVVNLRPTETVGFTISPSVPEADRVALISADFSTCEACWSEFHDPRDRRFGYAFINCTCCGPRYTIIQDTPYDRRFTTMAAFKMCSVCAQEYSNPSDRRFHTQPNACPNCGPGVALIASGERECPLEFQNGPCAIATLRQTRSLLKDGRILAMRGLGGFHLVCDAANEQAVAELRRRKRRSDKPFAVMAPSSDAVERLCTLSDTDRNLLLCRERPIVIAAKRDYAGVAPSVAPGNCTLGVMLPYTPLQHLLFADPGSFDFEFSSLVMTSGNISEEPIVTSNPGALDALARVADYFLLHNRDIYMRVDDSVTRSFGQRKQVLRRSRGYAPVTIDCPYNIIELLACGAELKNTFCLTRDRHAILSQHIGDLENYESLRFFEESLANLKKLFRVSPVAVAYDLHPRYLSTRFAGEYPVTSRIGVQHHHAHIASCMAENGVRGKVIGVAFDGTGYGTDGQIWGGEFLIADFVAFERRAHFRYLPLAGGDVAVRQPWRSALSYLRDVFGTEIPDGLPPMWASTHSERAIVEALLRQHVNTIKTSSCGRLFDAVASILGIRHEVTYEGQAAVELEQAITGGTDSCYRFDVADGELLEIDFRQTIETIVREKLAGVPTGQIAARFHNTVAACLAEVCGRLRTSDRLNQVCLSGGTFQNKYLLARSVKALQRAGFEVFLQTQVPANDGGISLGQAVIANAILQRES